VGVWFASETTLQAGLGIPGLVHAAQQYTLIDCRTERMLAPRILHFGHHQIFWDCAEMSACESLPAGLPLPLDRRASIDRHWRGRLQESGSNLSFMLSAANNDSPEDFWRAAVENYTSLSLTMQSDKRLAVWGIAKLVRDIIDEEYVAGLWEFALEEQLAWRVADCVAAERPRELMENPSWSWTSIKGRILVQDRSQQQERIYRVTNHANQPLSFTAMDKKVQPKLLRNASGDREEELANMYKDLQLAKERRERYNASSHRCSQIGAATSRQNSLVSVGRANSDKGLLFGYEQAALHGSNRELKQAKESVEKFSSRNDEEPKLLMRELAVQGYIHQGFLYALSDTDGWRIRPFGLADYTEEDAIMEAFPDTMENAQPGATLFVILALTEHFSDYRSRLSQDIPSDPENWFDGYGIMLCPSMTGQCYLRIGALDIHHLSARMWQYIQTVNKPQTGPGLELVIWEGTKFFIA